MSKFEVMEEALCQKDKLVRKLKRKTLKKLKKIETSVNNKVDQLIKDVKKSVKTFNHKKKKKDSSSMKRDESGSRLGLSQGVRILDIKPSNRG